MNPAFSLKHPNCSTKRLTPKDADILQQLYEQCAAFILLTDGLPPSPTAAREEFDDLPPGKTTEDIYIFGLFNAEQALLGMIAAVQRYPDKQTWWVGLMMLTPQARGQGLGTGFYRGFEGWVAAQGGLKISLTVIEENLPGLQFWQNMGFEVTHQRPPQPFKAKTHRVYVLTRLL